ncbi:MAG: hypothetical protein ABR915_16735 [Thermoguttaceae bacterium]|jgi:hypothetical protein
MHARQLVELAGVLSAQGAILTRGTQRLSANGLEQYWTASKCRLDRWGRSLRSFSAGAQGAEPVKWPHVRSVMEEILTGEVLTRVWTALACLCERRHGSDDAGAVARSVLVGHLEARHRVLMLLIQGRAIDVEAAVKMNHVVRRVERWTDLLLGFLGAADEVVEFAIDPHRARDFAEHFEASGPGRARRRAWPLVLASLRMAFRQCLAPTSPNEDLNQAIASAILACLPSEVLDSTGQFQSLWLLRLYNTTSDVQGMIESLLGPKSPSEADLPM